MIQIYKATNTINGKGYIGITNDLDRRQIEHYHHAIKNTSNFVFHRAIRKHGFEAFRWEILAESNTRVEAGKLEVSFIEKYGTFRSGYNSTTGGERAWEVSNKTCQKISQSNMGRTAWNKGQSLTDQHKTNISKAHLGVPKSTEQKNKMSLVKKGKPSNAIKSCILNRIEYASCTEAAKALGVSRDTITYRLKKEKHHGAT